MKTLIKTNNSLILVSDEEIKIGDFVWDGRTNPQEPDYPFYKVEELDDIPQTSMPDKKVLSQSPKLSKEIADEIGWIDVYVYGLLQEQLTKMQQMVSLCKDESWQNILIKLCDDISYIKLFQQKAQELNQKKYSEEDIVKFTEWIDDNEIPYDGGNWMKYYDGRDNRLTTKELFNIYLKSLSQNQWQVEAEEINEVWNVTKLIK